MSRFAGCTRFVYNKGIAWNEEQRNADSNFKISYKALSAQLPIWKENHPWLADTSEFGKKTKRPPSETL